MFLFPNEPFMELPCSVFREDIVSMRGSSYIRSGICLALLVCSVAQTAFIHGETIRYLPAKELSQFRVALAGGGNRTNPKGVFELNDAGALLVTGAKPGFLISKRTFADYILVVEYRWRTSSPDRDSGVFVNTVPKGTRFTALECDLPKPSIGLSGRLWLFGRPPKEITVKGRKYTNGGPPSVHNKSVERAIGEWNVMQVMCHGDAFQIKLNGSVTAEGSNPIPKSGAIMLQSGSGAIEFRKLEVTVLSSSKPAGRPTSRDDVETNPPAPVRMLKKPASTVLHSDNPEMLARKGLWLEAASAYAALIRKDPKRMRSLEGLKLGLLYAATGDRGAHAQQSREMHSASEKWKTPGDGGRPAKGWAAMPDAIDNGLADLARRGAEHATKNLKHPAIGWFSLTRGMVEYRGGRDRESLRWLRTPMNHKDASMRSAAAAFAAMASHRLGEIAQAQQSLTKAQAAFDAIEKPSQKDLGPLWHNYLAAKLALDEANSKLKGN
jgi:hypothetical protein